MHGREREAGQVSVELVALLPLVLGVALVVFQLLLVGASAWLASTAARDAARASALGVDPLAAAQRSLPAPFRRGLRVTEKPPAVQLRLRIPTVTGLSLGTVSATSAMEPQR